MMMETTPLSSQTVDASAAAPLHRAFAKVAGLSALPGEPDGLVQAMADFDAERGMIAPVTMSAFESVAKELLYVARRASAPQHRHLWKLYPDMRDHAKARMAGFPALARVYLYDGDGHLREAALRSLPDQPVDAALVATVMLRCNDWVPEVQAAARTALLRLVARLAFDQLASLLPFALGPATTWKRGGSQSVAALMAHPEWTPALRAHFLTRTHGPLARSLRQTLANADLDDALPKLAKEAKSVFVRAVAAEAVLAAEARWETGRQWRWIDKPMGLRKREAVVAKRPLTLAPDARLQVLRACVMDKAVPMRLLAADHLTRTGPSPDTEPLLRALRGDRADSVRKRMDFFDKRWPSGAGKDGK